MPQENPPHAALLQDINNETFLVYVYIGSKADLGGQVAGALELLIPRVRVYFISKANRSQMQEWLGGDDQAVAICFRWGNEVFKRLDLSQAENLLTVTRVVQDAMAPKQ